MDIKTHFIGHRNAFDAKSTASGPSKQVKAMVQNERSPRLASATCTIVGQHSKPDLT